MNNMLILKPKNPTKTESEELSSPEGMRNRIYQFRMYSPLIHACFSLAQIHKLDELDLMTLIAFEALSENQRLKQELEGEYLSDTSIFNCSQHNIGALVKEV